MRPRNIHRPLLMRRWADGVDTDDIALEFHTPVSNVHSIVIRERQLGNPLAVYRNRASVRCEGDIITMRLQLGGELIIKLRAEAQRRNISPTKLTSQLIETIIRDNLFNAIIEEDDENERVS